MKREVSNEETGNALVSHTLEQPTHNSLILSKITIRSKADHFPETEYDASLCFVCDDFVAVYECECDICLRGVPAFVSVISLLRSL